MKPMNIKSQRQRQKQKHRTSGTLSLSLPLSLSLCVCEYHIFLSGVSAFYCWSVWVSVLCSVFSVNCWNIEEKLLWVASAAQGNQAKSQSTKTIIIVRKIISLTMEPLQVMLRTFLFVPSSQNSEMRWVLFHFSDSYIWYIYNIKHKIFAFNFLLYSRRW